MGLARILALVSLNNGHVAVGYRRRHESKGWFHFVQTPRYYITMADQTPKQATKSSLTLEELRAGVPTRAKQSRNAPAELTVVPKRSVKKKELTPVQLKAAEYWSKGWTIPQIAKKMGHLICPDASPRKLQLQKARTRLRAWSVTQAFRDAVWNHTIIAADLASPAVVEGVVRKAASGRVDAARLVLELNGRHSPFTEDKPAAINIVFNGIPRPQSDDFIEGEAEELEDDSS